jgi:flagellin
MASQVKGLEQAARNTADGISMVQTVEGAGKEIVNILTRMKELAVQSATGTLSATDRAALNTEFTELEKEITRVQTNTKWNTMALMEGGPTTVNIQAGTNNTATDRMAIVVKDWSLDNATAGDSAYGVDLDPLAIDDAAGITQGIAAANTAITALDTAITNASSELATYGAYINRLEYAQDNLMNVAQNTDASRSRIEDADYASETSELAKTQIIAQAGTAMLAQANQIKQTVLALLQ